MPGTRISEFYHIKFTTMKIPPAVREATFNTICTLYVLLLMYAAVSKLLDFENFRVQLGQSPLLSAFAGLLSWLVPVIEIILALMLIYRPWSAVGMYGALTMMVMFTAYIYFILNYSSYVPCSCGGILEKMGWEQHLIFNATFVVLATVAIIVTPYCGTVVRTRTNIPRYITLPLCYILGSAIVFTLFKTSEEIIHNNNSFVRNFPPGTEKVNECDLLFNSYYFAGIAKEKLYLGNRTQPLSVTSMDHALKQWGKHTIKVDNTVVERLTGGVQLQVADSKFYLIDGVMATVFRGDVSNWSASPAWSGKDAFTHPQVIDSVTMALRKIDKSSGESELGLVDFRKGGRITLKRELLSKQVDGIFDSDGQLLYNSLLRELVYVYMYRNEIIIAGENMDLVARSKTIDTTSRAQVQVVYVTDRKELKLSAPPVVVNKAAASYGNLLYVNSGLPGRFEDTKMWEQASIVDVYDMVNHGYVASFYIYDIHGKKVRSMAVYGDRLYALIDDHLVSYRIGGTITKHYLSNRS